ncbi:hypothetical protein [Bacillus thuringiensis]|uniref:hypothetical protein n=1 Tax=Bacillus thuringiensis TaxID=1428 RepID=UPI0013747475|nr:hypothetical protein [Bacillus thuringiensis]MEB9697184.1 hypothetical protein [Bacillus cereus]
MKVARTVRIGGKVGDNFKDLPIVYYCNSVPIMLRETKTLRLVETKKSKAAS